MQVVKVSACAILAVGSAFAAEAQQATYFQYEDAITIRSTDATHNSDFPVANGTHSASVRMVSAWCELDDKAEGVFMRLTVPEYANGRGQLVVPMQPQFVSATNGKLYAGTIETFWSIPPGKKTHTTIFTNGTTGGLCHVSYYGDLIQQAP